MPAVLLRGGRIAMRLLASIGYQLLLSGGVTEPDGLPHPLMVQLLPLMRSGGVDALLVALE